MNNSYSIVIPARYSSERLPKKLLLDLAGRPLIEHSWRAACQSSADQVVIATDHPEIFDIARGFGAECVMTSAEHQSGSDRIAECAALMGWADDQLIVNLQGDEPSMPAACLEQVAGLLAADPEADVATLCWPISDAVEADDPNVVKVVFGQAGRALYFSRALIPHSRDLTDTSAAIKAGVPFYRHLGLYAYRYRALKAFTEAAPTPLEQAERLEQLRFLDLGRSIAVAQACEFIPPGIDTAADLERERQSRC